MLSLIISRTLIRNGIPIRIAKINPILINRIFSTVNSTNLKHQFVLNNVTKKYINCANFFKSYLLN